jgi:S-adenosylmethionine:tRNA ribosyltransferase-isomerase
VLDRKTGAVGHRTFRDLPDLLRAGDLLVMNRSRVFPARLYGRRSRGGGESEILLLRPTGPTLWEAFVRPGRRLKPGDQVEVDDGLTLSIVTGALAADGRREVRFECAAAAVDEWIDRLGRTPLPPYIRRAPEPGDRERYQTIYARERGSVAAPTAGLHFTPRVLEALHARGVETAEIVLHVGPGTFRPVQVDTVEEHRLPAEAFLLPGETARAIERTRARGGRVIAVGTTTVRTLEAVAAKQGRVVAAEGETDLVVTPGFSFRVVDGLLTNFHLPRSSLLLLTCAFGGRANVLAAYAEAVAEGYRFYSYGDAMMILEAGR